MHRFPSFSSRALALLLCMLLFASFGFAQTSRGTVSGNVSDSTGAVVQNATVTIVEVQTNVTRETKTNSAGLYRFDAVNLGIYTVKVAMSGFASQEVKGIEVKANQNAAVDFALKIGSSSETVEVAAANTLVALQVEEQLRGGSLGTKSLESLPISGQNSLNLMTVVAGIIPSNNGVADSGVGSVNGSRTRSNKFMIDGVDNNDISVAGPSLTLTNNDAIQEVSIQTSNFSAEFGGTGGAVVNQVTKSGTNTLHGTAAWVYRSQLFNAQTVSEGVKGSQAGLRENIPAYTIGGPVYIPHLYDGRNKTFFFAAGQWDRYFASGSPTNFYVPDAAGIATIQALADTGKCPNAKLYLRALNGMTAKSTLNSFSVAVPSAVAAANPTCDGSLRTGQKIGYGIGQRIVNDEEAFWNQQYRLDHTFSPKHSMSLRAIMDHGIAPGYIGISRPFDADYAEKSHNFAATETWVINNTMTNELRLNFFRIELSYPVVDSTGLGTLPIFTVGSGLSAIGTNTNYPQGRVPNTYQLQDTITKMIGRHQIRAGGEAFRQIARQIAPMNIRGTLTYATSGTGATLVNAFANFLDDYSGPGASRVSRSYGSNVYYPSYWSGSWFVQDSFKFRSNLTLNYGVRWDYFGQPANNFQYPVANLDPAGFSTEKLDAKKSLFGPSVGFAWNPNMFGDNKTVVRGGFQLSYDRFFNNLLSNMAAGTPNVASNVPVNAGTSGRGLAGLYSTYFPAMTPNGVKTTSDASSQFTSDITNPYTERWSLGVQRELPAGVILDASYVGAASHHLFQQYQLNPYGEPVLSGSGPYYTYGTRLVPTIGARTVRGSGANSNYNGLQVEVKRNLTETPVGKVQFTSAWTWSHALSVIDEVFTTYSSGATMMTANPLRYGGNRHYDYGNSDNDRRHRWVSTIVWDVRGPKKGFLGQALGGWQLGAVLPLQSATPFTIMNGVDRDFDGSAADRPDIGNPERPQNTMAQWVPSSTCSTNWQTYNGGSKGYCVASTDVYWLYYPSGVYSKTNAKTAGRNGYYTKTGYWSTDLNVLKTFKIREGLNLEYRAEIFNLFNHRNYNYAPANYTLSSIFNSDKDPNGSGNPSATFLDYSGVNNGNRSMRMGVKVKF